VSNSIFFFILKQFMVSGLLLYSCISWDPFKFDGCRFFFLSYKKFFRKKKTRIDIFFPYTIQVGVLPTIKKRHFFRINNRNLS
jgi:hypothetical protein